VLKRIIVIIMITTHLTHKDMSNGDADGFISMMPFQLKIATLKN
jgi:hypothetical protein